MCVCVLFMGEGVTLRPLLLVSMSTVNMYIPAQRTFATTFEDGLSTGHQCCSSGDCKIARDRTEQHKLHAS